MPLQRNCGATAAHMDLLERFSAFRTRGGAALEYRIVERLPDHLVVEK